MKKKPNILVYLIVGISLIYAAFYYARHIGYFFKSILKMFGISPTLTSLLVFICILIGFVSCVILYVLITSAREDKAEKKKAEAEAGGPTPEEKAAAKKKKKKDPAIIKTRLGSLRIRRSFARAEKMLRSNLPGSDYRYRIPWFLMLGETGSGKTNALAASGLNLPLGSPIDSDVDINRDCNWWFFEKGIVLDVNGNLFLQEDGKSADTSRWRLLLRLLKKYRPERPIDGVILTIPASDIVGFSKDSSADVNRISQKADIMYKKIWEMQKSLGVKYPIYVVITKCDEVKGFTSLSNELSKKLSNNVFGWSSPYPVDTAYSSEWCKEAFGSIGSELLQAQFELFIERPEFKDSDGIFIFNASMRKLFNPIQIYLDHLFRQSVYHESFIFRGIFFLGDAGDVGFSHNEVEPIFVKDLLEKKVFPEYKLTKPLKRALATKHRAKLFLKSAAAIMSVIVCIGLFTAYRSLKHDRTALVPVMEQIELDVGKLREKDHGLAGLNLYNLLRARSSTLTFEESAQHLFRGIINVKSLKYTFLPSSWVSDIHGDIHSTMSLAYDEIILKSMYLGLFQKAKDIFDTEAELKKQFTNTDEIQQVDTLDGYVKLKKFVHDIKEFEKYVSLYNNLGSSKDMSDMGELVEYLFAMELPTEFYKNAEFYHNEALDKSQYNELDPTIFRLKAKLFTLRKLYNNYYDQIFDANSVYAYFQVLSMQLDSFGQKSRTGENDGKMITNILDTIQSTENILKDQNLSWVFREEFDLGTSFDDILTMINDSDYLGPELKTELYIEGEKRFAKLKTDLKNMKTGITGPLLARSRGKVESTLSSGVLGLRADLEKLLNQEFMTFEPADGGVVEIPPGTRLRWDKSLLVEAIRLFEPYERYTKDKLLNFPADIQNKIRTMAQDNLEKKVMELVLRSQRFDPIPTGIHGTMEESDVLSEIRNFNEAMRYLNTLLIYFDQLDLVESYQVLSDVLYWQSSTLLATVDEFMNNESLYEVRGGDLTFWEGNNPAAFSAFDVVDRRELENYLEHQRQRIKFFAEEFSKPVIVFFSISSIPRSKKEEQIIFKWNRVFAELEKYDNLKPKNSLSLLEKFILFDMNEIDSNNYFTKISEKDLIERSGDFFLTKKNELRRLLYERCRTLAMMTVLKKYSSLKDMFNQKLAGRFPFSDMNELNVFVEAWPGNIRTFYKQYDKQSREILDVLKSYKLAGEDVDKALKFMNDMKALRSLFASYIDDADGIQKELPIFDFNAKFRVNREMEEKANQIIEWKLKVGNQEFTQNGNDFKGRWNYGDEIKLSLRWAKNSAAQPTLIDKKPGLNVTGGRVEYLLDNQWSLMRLIGAYKTEAHNLAADANPHTLEFKVQTQRGSGEGAKLDKAKAFVRMTLFSPDKQKNVLIQSQFPTKAPEIVLSGEFAGLR